MFWVEGTDAISGRIGCPRGMKCGFGNTQHALPFATSAHRCVRIVHLQECSVKTRARCKEHLPVWLWPLAELLQEVAALVLSCSKRIHLVTFWFSQFDPI